MKVCKIEITHIGENMPCTEAPGPTTTGYENTMIQYAQGVVDNEHACGEIAEYTFTVSTNFVAKNYLFHCDSLEMGLKKYSGSCFKLL